MHRSLARRAAMGRGLVAHPGDGRVEDPGVVRVHHRLHGEYIRMPAERLHGAENHGLPADLAVLLRPAGAGAKSASGCDEDGCSTLRSGHQDSIYETNRVERGAERKWRTALTMMNGENRVIPIT